MPDEFGQALAGADERVVRARHRDVHLRDEHVLVVARIFDARQP